MSLAAAPELARIPAGDFLMGAADVEEEGCEDDEGREQAAGHSRQRFASPSDVPLRSAPHPQNPRRPDG